MTGNSFEEDKKQIAKYKSDIFMREVACLLAEEELKEFEAAFADDSPVAFPEDFEKRMEKTLRDFQRRDRRSKRKVIYKEITRIAAIVMVCVGVSTVVMASTAGAFKVKLGELVWRDSGEHYEIENISKAELPEEIIAMFPEDWHTVFYPSEVPAGYKLESVKEEDHMRFLRFTNGEGERLDFSYIQEELAFTRIEKRDNVLRETEVGGNPGLCIENKSANKTILIWNRVGYQFKLTTPLDSSATAKMAESIAWVKLDGEETMQIADGFEEGFGKAGPPSIK